MRKLVLLVDDQVYELLTAEGSDVQTVSARLKKLLIDKPASNVQFKDEVVTQVTDSSEDKAKKKNKKSEE